jgi:hypothetical protein
MNNFIDVSFPSHEQFIQAQSYNCGLLSPFVKSIEEKKHRVSTTVLVRIYITQVPPRGIILRLKNNIARFGGEVVLEPPPYNGFFDSNDIF